NTALHALLRALGIAQASSQEVLEAVNKQRELLSLPALQELTPTTSIRDGLSGGVSTLSAQRVPKAQAAMDLASLEAALVALDGDDAIAEFQSAADALEALKNDETLLDGVVRDDMLRTALELFDGDACPVCDTQFSLADFREKILGKREKLAK